MFGNRFFAAAMLFFGLVLLTATAGAVPPLLSYSGTLTDTDGNPVADGTYDVEFSIYDVATGGTALWTEVWGASTVPITTVQGAFSVLLGSHVPIPDGLFSDHPDTYLGVRVGADTEMLPRQRIASVAYAMRSGDGVPRGAIIMWRGVVDQAPDGWVLCDGENGTPDLQDRFVVGVGAGYNIGDTGGAATVNTTHTHAGPNHTHSITPDGANHTHTFSGNTGTPNEGEHDASPSGSTNYADDLHTHPFSGTTGTASSNHSHGGATGAAGSGQTGSAGVAAQENRPPYFALAFIMKL